MKRENEAGTAFVLGVFLCCLCLLVILSTVKLGKVLYLSSKTQNAADAAALSGAYEIANSSYERVCQAARNIASKNESVLLECKKDEYSVEVLVQSRFSSLIKARAKAIAS
ncbi:MAG: Rv3654c family TadE-like protein [Acidimicrobiia bacterium]